MLDDIIGMTPSCLEAAFVKVNETTMIWKGGIADDTVNVSFPPMFHSPHDFAQSHVTSRQDVV